MNNNSENQNLNPHSNNPVIWIRTIYFYLVTAACILAFAVSGFVLLRRIAIDVAFPDLRSSTEGYYYPPSYSSCTAEEYGEERCKEIDKEQRQQEQERIKKTEVVKRQEQYLYSTLTILITSVIFGVHFKWVKPNTSTKINSK